MTELDILIGKTQRTLSAVTLALIGGVLFALFVLPLFMAKPIEPTVEKLLYVILGALVSNLASQNQFWFGRPRSAGVPDPTAVGPVANIEHMNVAAPPAGASSDPPKETP